MFLLKSYCEFQRNRDSSTRVSIPVLTTEYPFHLFGGSSCIISEENLEADYSGQALTLIRRKLYFFAS